MLRAAAVVPRVGNVYSRQKLFWRRCLFSCTGNRHCQQAQATGTGFFQRGFGPAFFVGSFSVWGCAKGVLHDRAEGPPETLAETLAEILPGTWAGGRVKQAGICGAARQGSAGSKVLPRAVSKVWAAGQFLAASEAMTCGGKLSTIQSTHCWGFLQVASQHRVA